MTEDRIAQGKSIWRQAATGKFIVPIPGGEQSPIRNQIGIAARSAVCFDIGNVAEYFYAGNDKDYWLWQKDIPCMAPPFHWVWMEHGAPSRVGRELLQDSSVTGFGALIQSIPLNPDGVYFDDPSKVVKPLTSMLQEWSHENGGRGWAVEAMVFQRLRGHGTIIMPLHLWFRLDEFGRPNLEPQIFTQNGNAFPDGVLQKDGTQALTNMFPAALALSFLHCKNVRVGEKVDERKPADRARDLRAGIPEVKFKTLEIEPMRKVLASEGGIAENGLKKALHICRGHFSHYSEERPLFGKYSGQFWIPAHVRGTTESGQVIKDYKVNAPRNATA